MTTSTIRSRGQSSYYDGVSSSIQIRGFVTSTTGTVDTRSWPITRRTFSKSKCITGTTTLIPVEGIISFIGIRSCYFKSNGPITTRTEVVCIKYSHRYYWISRIIGNRRTSCRRDTTRSFVSDNDSVGIRVKISDHERINSTRSICIVISITIYPFDIDGVVAHIVTCVSSDIRQVDRD